MSNDMCIHDMAIDQCATCRPRKPGRPVNLVAVGKRDVVGDDTCFHRADCFTSDTWGEHFNTTAEEAEAFDWHPCRHCFSPSDWPKHDCRFLGNYMS